MDGRLAGKRIGLPRATSGGTARTPTSTPSTRCGCSPPQGATIVDHTDLASLEGFDGEDELLVMLAELRDGLAPYLAGRPGDGPRDLADVVAFNRANADAELAHFGQSLFERALAGPGTDSPEYAAARARCVAASRDDGIDAVLARHDLDVLLTPSYPPAMPIDLVNAEPLLGSCTGPAAMAGYPLLTVPSGLAGGLPVAVTFWGGAGREATLLEVGAGYEAARDRDAGPLPPPTFAPFV